MDKLLIDPATNEEYVNVPAEVAAKYLGVTKKYIYDGLQQQRLPFGTAVFFEKQWKYNIPPERLKIYKSGFDISMLNTLLNEVQHATK